MENQHKKIKGYRDLSQGEIDLMNEAKALGNDLKAVIDKIDALHDRGGQLSPVKVVEKDRALCLAQDSLQTGMMWLIRSVALPDTFS